MDRVCSRIGWWKIRLGWRILHSEELNIFYRADEIKEHIMGSSCVTYGGENVVLDSDG
jgi:hypothetical protein